MLSACATPPGKVDVVPRVIEPVRCPDSMTAPLIEVPVVPDGAGVPEWVSEEQRLAFVKYATWVADVVASADAGWARAATGKAFCEGGQRVGMILSWTQLNLDTRDLPDPVCLPLSQNPKANGKSWPLSRADYQ